MNERRPSSKALLELAAGEGRGKLKVFLGMAPGVGKTYAMLSTARALKAEGADVVVGVVETHGRSETAALLEGLEVLPRRLVPYRSRSLMEFDVDAAIARKPALLLVDEFAHTNAPGVVHAKRYQDVEGVLQAGINVWTTLNVQHLESLNDVVQRITGVTVSETVPDRVLERADEIVVVDLPPEELIQRLREGKVYLPENARRAIDQFFRPSNLTALRELALRRTADRVDEQMIAELRRQGIEGPWPSAERMLVCVGGDEMAEAVVRAAGRIAQAQKCDWSAIHVRMSDREITDRAVVKRTDKAMRLAERLGGTTVRLTAQDLVAELLAYAKRNNITQLVVGRSRMGLLGSWLRRSSLSDELLSKARGLAVTVVTPEAEPERSPFLSLPSREVAFSGGMAAAVAVALATILGVFAERATSLPNVSMIFLLAVLVCAMRFGVWSAVSASLLSFLAYNFFFIDPRYTLTVAQPHELLSLMIFLIVAIATGGLAGRMHEQADATRERAEMMEALFDFSRKLSAAAGLKDVVDLLARQCSAAAKGRSVVLIKRNGQLEVAAGLPRESELTTSDWAAARWADEKAERSGRFTGTLPTAQFQFWPISPKPDGVGVVGVAPDASDETLSSATESALRSFADQAALAIERTALVEEAQKAETNAEAERLRSALLSSVSHDLKTPLASIVGSVTSLRELGDRMPKKAQGELLETIEQETERLRSFVENLLDMTRLEAGALDICKDWVDVGEVIKSAVSRAEKSFPSRKTELKVAVGLPLVRGDGALLEQVLFNLLDNADKYSGKASITRASVSQSGASIIVEVSDQGIGIPADDLGKVFEKFYRVARGDGRAAGTGLGLSIAAGLIKAMGGTIRAESPVAAGKGTRIVIMLPAGLQAGAQGPERRDEQTK
ncbi:MAG: sensor histidine kinase KdpD [Hyphomicrobium sp.]|jgi:two-component system sensor histidine kinase KdpD